MSENKTIKAKDLLIHWATARKIANLAADKVACDLAAKKAIAEKEEAQVLLKEALAQALGNAALEDKLRVESKDGAAFAITAFWRKTSQVEEQAMHRANPELRATIEKIEKIRNQLKKDVDTLKESVYVSNPWLAKAEAEVKAAAEAHKKQTLIILAKDETLKG